uniref:Uncharacterized protein n=1 Tax=Rhizophora mucronata TaxID=61149 RepID=A0A2P2R441_RHIMU
MLQSLCKSNMKGWKENHCLFSPIFQRKQLAYSLAKLYVDLLIVKL